MSRLYSGETCAAGAPTCNEGAEAKPVTLDTHPADKTAAARTPRFIVPPPKRILP